MTLLYFDGFDNAALLRKPEAIYLNNAPTSVVGRDGSTNGAFGINSGFNGLGGLRISLPTAAATCVAGVAYYPDALNVAADVNDGLMIWYSGGTRRLHLVLSPTGFLELRLSAGNGTILATSSGHSALAADTWHHIQAKVTLHASAGTAEVRLNNQTVINYSGQTSTVTGDVSHWSYMNETGQNLVQRIDDLWICDTVDATSTQGRPNNDFLGDLKVATIVPDGAGDTTTWTPSTGANWSTLDENPPNTTDYVSTSAGTPGTRDLYTATDLPATAADVIAVRSGLYVTKTDVGLGAVKTVVKQDGVVEADASPSYLPMGYTPVWGDVRTTNVADDTPLTVSDIDNMQIGIETG